MTHRASCSCGQLTIACDGDPIRISMCHCQACQQRTGSVFGVQVRFTRDQVVAIEGPSTAYTRPADSGNTVTFHFCPTCGTTLYWQLSVAPDIFVVAVGAFPDSDFPPPRHSVWEAHRHDWTQAPGALPMENLDGG